MCGVPPPLTSKTLLQSLLVPPHLVPPHLVPPHLVPPHLVPPPLFPPPLVPPPLSRPPLSRPPPVLPPLNLAAPLGSRSKKTESQDGRLLAGLGGLGAAGGLGGLGLLGGWGRGSGAGTKCVDEWQNAGVESGRDGRVESDKGGRLEREVAVWVEGVCRARGEGEWMVVMACEDTGGGIPPEEMRWVLDPYGGDLHHSTCSSAADDAAADGGGDAGKHGSAVRQRHRHHHLAGAAPLHTVPPNRTWQQQQQQQARGGAIQSSGVVGDGVGGSLGGGVGGAEAAVQAVVAGRRVAVVDDNAVNRMVARRTLQGYGADMLLLASGEDTLQALSSPLSPSTSLQLLLLDLHMPPGIDGVIDATAAPASAAVTASEEANEFTFHTSQESIAANGPYNDFAFHTSQESPAAEEAAIEFTFQASQEPTVAALKAKIEEAAGLIRASPQRLCIIALTADLDVGVKRACFEAGMDGAMRKPIVAHELLAALVDAEFADGEIDDARVL
ncbi:unnamed protein product [Closterium sp. Naga37s-1]|nr:unnamed protein product [Closterium sp. Naga37s-1]